jgi:hypothetical protein
MIAIFLGYVLGIVAKYGVQKSISESYYKLPRNQQFIFTLFCWGFALPAILISNTLIMFFAGAGIILVGTAAAFKSKMTYEYHMIGAFVGVILSQLSIAIDYHLYWLNLLFIVPSLLLIILTWCKIKVNYFWWIEILAFISVCIVLTEKL